MHVLVLLVQTCSATWQVTSPFPGDYQGGWGGGGGGGGGGAEGAQEKVFQRPTGIE